MDDGFFLLQLIEAPLKKQALFGDNAWVDNGVLGKALYASRTRQQILPGSLIRWKQEEIAVTGTSWEDYQLTSTINSSSAIRWNWFALLIKDSTVINMHDQFKLTEKSVNLFRLFLFRPL